MRDVVIQKILSDKLIAIVRGIEVDKIIPLTKAITDGGIKMVEITFNQANPDSFSLTAEGIRAISKEFAGEVLVGAGTVCTKEQLKLAYDAGALYIITPATDPELIKEVRNLGLVAIPGALTPTECLIAHNAGADFIKLFPLGSLGVNYLKAIKAPLSHLRFLGVGGINENNIKEYLEAGALGCGIGGNLVNKDWIEAGEFHKIEALARKYVEAVASFVHD
jgi:2-dehydro-3-deoxyphosphogluconate aldolase/(4S)-4-hydroxy-2-oxoglutarate aldolase